MSQSSPPGHLPHGSTPAPAHLRALGPHDPAGDFPYDRERAALDQWRANAKVRHDGTVTAWGDKQRRATAIARSIWWPYRHDQDVYVARRDSWEPPSGGLLDKLVRRSNLADVARRFARLSGSESISESTLRSALLEFEGTATELAGPPWNRWGRDDTGQLWWDSGGDVFVRVGPGGWSLQDRPHCWMTRTRATVALPLPEAGGRIDELWHFVPCLPEDRPLIVMWMLAAMIPEEQFPCGMLLLTGERGSAKTTSARFIAHAAGSPAATASIPERADDPDFVLGVAAGWINLFDNISALSLRQSDLLCTLTTGKELHRRILYTTEDTTVIRVRRPLIITSIGLPVLQPDLIDRTVPVRMPIIDPAGRSQLRALNAEFQRAQPRIFGALLTLLAATMAAPEPELALPRMADMAVLGAKADILAGHPIEDGTTPTLARLDRRASELEAGTVEDDTFFDALKLKVSVAHHRAFWGPASALDQFLDPTGELRRTAKDWPATKAITTRLDRHAPVLRKLGWTVERHDNGHHGVEWEIVAPPPLLDF